MGHVPENAVLKFAGLVLYCRDDAGMIVAEVTAPPGRYRVKIFFTFNIIKPGTLAADNDREIIVPYGGMTGVGVPEELSVNLSDFF